MEGLDISSHVDIINPYRFNRFFSWGIALSENFLLFGGGIYCLAQGDVRGIILFILGGIILLPAYFALRRIERNAKKERRFTITQKEIEIVRWDTPVFQIDWSTLKTINVEKWDESTRHSIRFYYNFDFFSGPIPRSITLDAGYEFSPRKVDCFLFFLVQFCRQQNVPIFGHERGIRRKSVFYSDYKKDLQDWEIFRSRSLQKKWEDFNTGFKNRF